MRLFALLALGTLVSAPVAFAVPGFAADLPPSLVFRGHPIDPLCLTGFEEEPVEDLKDCTAPSDILRQDGGGALVADAEGWYGYSFKYADMADYPPQAWAGWRYLGDVDRGPVVETRFSGGGTGWFTAVHILRRDDDALRIVETLAGGDRCNGGVVGAAVVDGRVLTASSLTPFDLVAWALREEGGPPLADDAQLAYCAICCVGAVTALDGEPAWVTMNGMAEGFARDEGDTLAVCLDGLLEDKAWPGRILDRPALAAFGRTFRNRCLD